MIRKRVQKMYYVILQVLPVLILSYIAQILMKRGSAMFGNFTWEEFVGQPFKVLSLALLNWQIMIGFLLAGIGALFYLFVLSKHDFSLVFPILGALGFLVLPLISWLVLGETVTLNRLIGTVIIAVGMLVVARG